jgi:collagen type IX alpha
MIFFFLCSKLFPIGLPEEFSFICTYKARRLPNDKWHIIKLTDSQNRPQFLITVDGKNKTLEFSIVNYEGRLQTLRFKSPPVSCSPVT